MEPLQHRTILGMRVDATSYTDATRRVITWAKAGEAGYVCVSNVHMTMETYDSPEFRQLVNSSRLVTPDGMPLVWGLKLLGLRKAERVYGPTLTLHVCRAAAEEGVPIGLYGGTDESLSDFCAFLRERFPKIRIACAIAPPFRPLTADEDEEYTRRFVESGARIIFAGIGCPKQERWMAAHVSRIPAIMLGVGAAFDFHSGRVVQAPSLLQRLGLEWLFRLAMEPKRLFKRYAKHNPRFVGLFVLQLAGMRRFR